MTTEEPEHEFDAPDFEVIEVRSNNGVVFRSVALVPNPELASAIIEQRLMSFRDALDRFAAAMNDLPPWPPLPEFQVQRGGIRYGEGGGWVRPGWPDRRQGDEVYVYDLLPGARVYVLEDVFTVDRVDMDAPLPTVWLKELPTSPLYFSEDESIYLANETED